MRSIPKPLRGRYILDHLIGYGRTGHVFRARSIGQGGFERTVAIKILRPDLLNDGAAADRLISEATALLGKHHGNIVNVLDLIREDEEVLLVMEYVDGPSVRELLHANGGSGIPPEISTSIVQAAASGVAFAHDLGAGLIHAELSSTNILLGCNGDVRVAAFGTALCSGHAASEGAGGLAYLAPEQVRGEPPTPRSDVFSLGIIFYELLTGRHPIGLRPTAEHRPNGRLLFVRPSTINPLVPPGLDEVCVRAMAHEPDRRFQNMTELISALTEQRFKHGWRESAQQIAVTVQAAMPDGSAADSASLPPAVALATVEHVSGLAHTALTAVFGGAAGNASRSAKMEGVSAFHALTLWLGVVFGILVGWMIARAG